MSCSFTSWPYDAKIPFKNPYFVKSKFKQYLKLESLRKDQKLLQEKSLKTRRGKNFFRQTIVNILRNPIYKGKFKHSGVEVKIDPIVHPRIFNQVQRWLGNQRKR